jgi:hypothetical protein
MASRSRFCVISCGVVRRLRSFRVQQASAVGGGGEASGLHRRMLRIPLVKKAVRGSSTETLFRPGDKRPIGWLAAFLAAWQSLLVQFRRLR